MKPKVRMTGRKCSWKVAFIGECMIELQRAADGTIRQTFGGDTCNTAVYFSRLGNASGMAAEYVSALGDDSFSRAMRAFWQAENVSSSLTRSMPGRCPGLYFIEVDGRGERSFTYWRGEAAARDTFMRGEGDAVLEKLGVFDAVYLSGISLAVLRDRERLLARLEELGRNGVRVFFDGNFRPLLWPGDNPPMENARPWYDRMLSLADTLFLSRDEIAVFGFSPDADARGVCAAMQERGPSEVVLKDGGNACLVAHPLGIDAVPARAVAAVVDTTAAGDSFAAAYIVHRRLRRGPAEAAGLAHELAARVIGHKGAIIPLDAMPGDAMPGDAMLRPLPGNGTA